MSFDHGAQYVTARDDRFKRYVQSWIDDKLVQRWSGRIVVVEKGTIKAEKTDGKRYVAVPGMSSLGKHIASDLSTQLETKVAAPIRSGDKWLLTSDDRVELGQFDVVVVAVPSHQAAPLLVAAPQLADQSSSVKMNGCWALMDEGSSRCTWTPSVGDLQSPNLLSELVVGVAKSPEGTDLWGISP